MFSACKILFASIFLCASATAFAASPTATLAGRVTDQNGAAVAGAKIEATDLGTNAVFAATTNDEGRFVVPELPPGAYAVRASQTGFQTAVRENVILTVAATTTVNFTLRVGEASAVVTVEGEQSEIVERDSAAVGTLVNRQFIENMPLNGRSFQSLIELTPGVVLTQPSIQNSGQFSVNGQRSNANYFTLDGVSANVGTATNAQFYQQAAGTLPGLSVLGGTNSLASVDTVQEFRVLTSSYEAEYGRQPGGQVIISTRSGKNDLNFTIFEYLRNEKFDANDWFDNRAGRGRRALRQNDFGGVIGGPVLLPAFGEKVPAVYDGRNRTFFFVSYEGLRLVQPQPGVLTARVPSRAARALATGAFREILNAFPLPNAARLAGDPVNTERYVAALSYPSRLDATSVRIDHKINRKISLFGRFNEAPSNQRFRSFPSQENVFANNLRFFTVGSTQVFSSRITNDLRVNWTRTRGLFEFAGIAADGAVLPPDGLLFPGFAPRENTAVSILLGGSDFGQNISAANLTQGKTLGTKQRQLQIVDNLTTVVGNHQLKFGVDYRRLTPVFDSRSLGITYNFSDFGTLAPTNPNFGVPASIDIQAFAPVSGFEVENFSAFAQDTWRATTRLTLNFGLRWELNPPLGGDFLPYNAQSLENPLTATLAPANTKQWRTRYDNFAPRVGVAYTVSEKHDLVARAGFGIFYDLGTGTALRGYQSFPYNVSRSVSRTQAPNVVRFPASEADLRALVPSFLDAAPPPYSANFSFFDANLRLPLTRQWNVSLEKGFGNQSITISYVGAQGRRLLREEQLRNYNTRFVAQRFCNQPGGATLSYCAPLQPIIVINPAIFGPAVLNPANPTTTTVLASDAGSAVSVTRNAAESDYHALQAQYQRRLSQGLQVLASYSFAKALDNVSEETFTGIPLAADVENLERGAASFDVRHSFVAAVSYDLPAIKANRFARAVTSGWSVDAFLRLRTAQPFSVITQNFDALNIGTTRRVDVTGQPFWLDDAAAPGGRRLNPAAFRIPPAGRQGNLGRNSLRAFAQKQIDLALRREFSITDKLRLQFRGEAFNVFNTPNFSAPAASCSATSASNLVCADNGTFGFAQTMLGRGLSGVAGSGTQTSPSAGFNPLYNVGGPRSFQFAFKILY
jgi:hypothetical protein